MTGVSVTDAIDRLIVKARNDRPQEAPSVRLTKRERAVLALLMGNGSNKQIAVSLHLSDKTVVNYVHRLSVKYGVYGQYTRGAFWREVVRDAGRETKAATA